MRRNTQISVYTTEEQVEKLAKKYRVYKEKELEIRVLGTIIIFDNLYSDSDIYIELMKDIEIYNLRFGYAEYREYTNKELLQAELYHVDIPYPWEHEPEKDAEYYGTQFNYPHGRDCVCTREQISELVLNTKKIGKWQFVRIIPELIVSELTKNIIEEYSFTGCQFLPVANYKGRETKSYYQIVVTNILPSISQAVRIEVADMPEHQCELCPYVGYRRSEFIYEKNRFGEYMDFNLTYERFDAYQTRELIVSSKVKEAFNKHKIKLYRFEPIRFI